MISQWLKNLKRKRYATKLEAGYNMAAGMLLEFSQNPLTYVDTLAHLEGTVLSDPSDPYNKGVLNAVGDFENLVTKMRGV